MANLRFFLCFLLLVNISYQINIENSFIDGVYDKIVCVLKGLSAEGKCPVILMDKKEKVIELVNYIIETGINNINPWELYMKSMEIHENMLEYCDPLTLISKVVQFQDYDSRRSLIEQAGRNIVERYIEVFDCGKQFLKIRGIEGKLEVIGKMISIILDFSLT